jgi:hypothetical protein
MFLTTLLVISVCSLVGSFAYWVSLELKNYDDGNKDDKEDDFF